MSEVWLPCPEFEHAYEVSNLGRVRSFARGAPRILFLGSDSSGYPIVLMNKGGRRMARTVHRLVCRAFHGEQPNPIHNEVAHLDGDRKNANAENLKWVGKRQNHSHRKAHGTWPTGHRHPRAKLSEHGARCVKALRGAARAKTVARLWGISSHTVYDIWCGERWPHLSIAFAGDAQ